MSFPARNFLDLVQDKSGGNQKVPKGKYLESGIFPIVDQGQSDIAGYSDLEESCFKSADLPVIIFGDHTRAVKYVDFPFAMGADGVKVLKPSDECDTRYLYHYLTYADIPSAGYSRHYKFLKELKIPLPSLSEQRRVAAILDKADALRQQRREAIAKLDELLQSVFLDMFGDPVMNPKGWEVLSVADVCSDIVDCVNRTAPLSEIDTPYRMIRTTNIRHGKVSLRETRCVEKDVFDNWNRRLTPQNGDVILTREAPAGEAGILDSELEVFLGQRLMLYRVNLDKLTPEFLLFSFMGTGMQRQFLKGSSGSTVKHLSVPACRSWNINVPPINLQEKFARVVEAQKATLHSLNNAVKAHEVLFSSLQQQAFNGTL